METDSQGRALTEDRQYNAAREMLEGQYGDMKVWNFIDLIQDRQKAKATPGRTASELYRNTAGKIEARNFVTSMYGKDGFEGIVSRAAEDGRIIYNNKKRTRPLFANARLQLPGLLVKDGFFMNSIPGKVENVNGEISLKTDSQGRALTEAKQEANGQFRLITWIRKKPLRFCREQGS